MEASDGASEGVGSDGAGSDWSWKELGCAGAWGGTEVGWQGVETGV